VATVGDLVVKLTADTGGFDNGIKGVIDKLGGLGTLGIAGAVAAAGAAIGAFVNSSVEHVKSLDNAMLQFQVNTGATAQQAAQFSNQLRVLYRGNTDSMTDLAAAATMVTQRFGEQGDGLGQTTQAFLNYAKVTGQNTASAIDQMADIMAKLNIEIDDGAGLMDSLAAVAQRTGTPITELQSALQASAGQFAAMGFTGDEAVAMLGAFTAAGLDATSVVRAFNGFINNTNGLTEAQASAMQRLGVELDVVSTATSKTVKAAQEHGIVLTEGQRLTDEMRSQLAGLGVEFSSTAIMSGTHREALEQMFAQMSSGEPTVQTLQDMMTLFGTKVGPELATAISTGALSLDDFMELVANSEGTVSRASATYDKQLGERWELLRRQYMEPFMNFIGAFFVKALHLIIDAVEVVAASAERAFAWIKTTFENLNESMGETGTNLTASLTAVFDAIVLVVTAAFTLIVSVWESVLKPAIEAWAPFFTQVFQAIQILVTGSIKAITSLLNAFAAFLNGDFTAAWEYMKEYVNVVLDTLKALTETIWDAILIYYTNVLNLIRKTFTSIWEAITAFLTHIFTTIFELAKNRFNAIREAILNAITATSEGAVSIFTTIGNFFDHWLEKASTLFTQVWTSIKTAVMEIWNATLAAAIEIFETLLRNITSTLENLESVFNNVWKAIKDAVTSNVQALQSSTITIFQTLSTALEYAMTTLKSALETVWNGISTSASDIWIGVANAVMFAFNAVPAFFANLWTSVVATGTTALNNVVSMINGLLTRWNSISFTLPEVNIPSVEVFGQTLFEGARIGGGTVTVPQIPTLPGFARGGLVRGPTIAMVGEAGPELITPLDRLNQFMGGGEQTIVVELDGRAIMQSVAPRMIDQIRLRGGFGNY
jgi:TP901 family phage tail tape measure protein